jgi:hypothetical protein
MLPFTQPARTTPVQPVTSIDSHLVRHPKAKLAAARTKSAAVKAEPTTARATPVVATPMPAVRPAAKVRKP